MQKTKGLQPKHWKALELWEEGLYSIKEIAAACGMGYDSLLDLFEGNSQKMGELAHLFKAELDKINVRTTSKIKTLSKDNHKIALLMMNDRLKELNKIKKKDVNVSKEVTRIMNSLSKVTPSVEINSQSLSFTKGMTPEELVYEFRRLSAIARNPSVGGRVPGFGPGTEGRVPPPATEGDAVPEE
jgi:hypothetical protein